MDKLKFLVTVDARIIVKVFATVSMCQITNNADLIRALYIGGSAVKRLLTYVKNMCYYFAKLGNTAFYCCLVIT